MSWCRDGLPVELVADLEEYEDWLVGRNFSPTTVKCRVEVAGLFLRSRDRWEVRPSEVATWLRQYTGWTASSYFGHLRSAYGWALETGRVEVDPLARLKSPPRPSPAPSPLSADTMREVLAQASGNLRAYLLLAYLAGLRAHEVAKFRGEDITADTVAVVGKGGKSVRLPTHPLLWELAQEYPRAGYWFTPRIGTNDHVRGQTVSDTVRRHLRRLGVPKGSLHRVRASFGTELLRGGTNIKVVQDLMRHSSLASTEHYLGVAEDDRRDAIAGLTAPRHLQLVPRPEQLPEGFAWDAAAEHDPREGLLPDERACEGCCVNVATPCPDWCDVGHGHPYDHRGVPHEVYSRTHTRGFGHGVVIEAFYEAATPDGPEVLEAVGIEVYLPKGPTMGAVEAQAVGAALAKAGAELTRLGLDQLPRTSG